MRDNSKFVGYLFEVAWILPSVAIPIVLFVSVVITAFAVGIRVPTDVGRVDPQALAQTAPFDNPGIREMAPGVYEATVIAQVFMFTPNSIEVPLGSKVTFTLTSRDVVHGFKIEGTDVNGMVVPGQITKVTATFRRPGEYLIVCHEYCGGGHQAMFGKVIVK
ncbi:cytochrome c oxidase subunit II [Oscillochloris sp. ZM17-4]|uniref:cytochrome c oxidase subunit II n=1 Tax=Oscillochloris sp. ZM17-4 TaxID=2866714 RepID=UPI001C730F4E|nr:cytochrome c oxidase subunit II [Oscillochloris sp. ZM17-4]MBX0327778.1 cytochrome c oxidase subunit II [Oscillochloris sp. ZM17-4]